MRWNYNATYKQNSGASLPPPKTARLSPTLEAALHHFKHSTLIKGVLPPHIYNNFIQNKELECLEFNKTITNYEIKKYYPIL